MSTVDVELDNTAPDITITTPNINDLIGLTAPSYSLSITEGNLDSIWYSLDGGITNSSFVGSIGTINQALWDAASNGSITITFWVNDTLGNIGTNAVTIQKDSIAPLITINQPIGGQVFNETSPNFDLSISENNLDSVWYTLDDGITNTTIISFTGTINQQLWNFVLNGNTTITFYANDTLGNSGFSEVIIEKKIIDTQGPLLTSLVESSDPLELGQAISIQVTAFDISNISSVQIEILGIKYNMTSLGGDIYEYQWIPGNTANLLYTIFANDTVGNANFLIDSVTIQDTTLPTFSNLSESEDLVDPGNSIITTLDATDISGIQEVIISFEGYNYNMTNTVDDTWSYTLTAPDAPGAYHYVIFIIDNNNNINSIEGSFRVGGVVSGTPGEPTNGNTIQLFLGIIGILGIANIVLIFKKFRGGKS
jgi:hypothetical protein